MATFRASAPSRRAVLAGGLGLALSAGRAAAARPVAALNDLARGRGLVYGAATEPEHIDADAGFAALARRHCGLLTAENVLKWDALRPAPDRFDFARADRLLAQARDMGQALHGHGLTWHEALPGWFAGTATAANAAALLTGHIAAVVGRYRGRIASWDVVVEAVERNDGRPDGLRLSPWARLIGPGYIDQAFHAAHEADPAARLVLEDYGLEYDDVTWMREKRGTMLALLKSLRGRGVPVHALGIQAHLLGEREPAFGTGLEDFLHAVADLGLDIHISELDVNEQKVEGTPEMRDAVIARTYRAFLDRVLRVPAVRRVVTWGLSDRYSSEDHFFPRADGRPQRPLPFDAGLEPKPAAQAMAAAFGAAAPR